ncbi:MAG: hypothetical protein M3335_08340 [Actinomycetota bacterium]|nr:hypothetical protein [Actinomycetota bacterium]
MSANDKNPKSTELYTGGAPLLLSLTSYLLGSTELAVIALVASGISFGISLGARALS